MCEEKKIPQEINDEDLEQIAGGAADANGNWVCIFCKKSYPEVKNNSAANQHFMKCPNSPFFKG